MATLDFKGKALVQNYHLTVKYHELVPKRDKSLTDKVRLDDNLIIHGDNLKALKALLPTYAGRVKCIYIDPPYNTGNDGWAYNDNVNSPMMQEWLGKTVDREDLTRHDKWLCLLMPRLKLLCELLNDDGIIFISIDDNEQHRLRMLLDEVLGEENFVSVIVVQSNKRGQTYKEIAKTHEYILVYSRNPDVEMLEFEKEGDKTDFDKVFVVESKGIHLKNEDTDYKKQMFKLCNKLAEAKSWTELGLEFPERKIVFELVYGNEWQKVLNGLLK